MSQKLENQLSLALEVPEEMRQKTQELNTGFQPKDRTWELIVKYSGEPEQLTGLGILVEPLIAGYAILTVPESMVERIAADPQIEYVEKPKNLYESVQGPSAGACIAGVSQRAPFLSGKGVLLAVIDSGITYRRPEFIREDGGSRILYLWDQTLTEGPGLPGPPSGFGKGVEFDRERIDRAVRLPQQEGFMLVPSLDVSGHGTAVAGIAAASYTMGYQGAAPEAELLIVKLGGTENLPAGYSKTTDLMRAVTYAVRKGQELKRPLVINLSFGNTYGPHNGSSLLERFLDNASEIGRTVICVGSGNEGSGAGHLQGILSVPRTVRLAVADFERNLSLQVWKHFGDSFRIRLRAPGGSSIDLTEPEDLTVSQGRSREYLLEGTRIIAYYGPPKPYSVLEEIYLEMIPAETGDYLAAGIWEIQMEPVSAVNREYLMYLPSAVNRNRGTGFLEPSPWGTFTIPSTAGKVITVGAYDPVSEAYADFSGRGFQEETEKFFFGSGKPNVTAPGVNIPAPDVYGGYVSVSGTSFSVPLVSGSAALLMEWGIIRGNDPYLYGEKMKAYLQKGAQRLRGENTYPNPRVGYGAACAAASLPEGTFQ